jgi:hypothetical protein
MRLRLLAIVPAPVISTERMMVRDHSVGIDPAI